MATTFTASCTDPATGKTTTSEVETLDEAKLRCRTLKGLVMPPENRAGCSVSVTTPEGVVYVMDNASPPGWVVQTVPASATAPRAKTKKAKAKKKATAKKRKK